MSALVCKNLSLVRGGAKVLNNVSLTQSTPALVGLLGPNGAGKTTLMRSIVGLQKADSGQIELAGVALNHSDVQTRARLMAYLPQERIVHWQLKVVDVVMLGRLPYQSTLGVSSDVDQKAVTVAMQSMEVSQFAERAFSQLSGGEQARVLIARTLAQAPQLLLADEPVNGLDPEHQISLMQTFKRIVADGCTVMTSLHDLSLAARFCDRVVLLNKGEIVADGTPEAVMTAETLSAVYRVVPDIRKVDGQLLITPLHTL